MSPLRGEIRHRGERFGGAIGYPSERLFEEVAYIAYHFNWPHDQILGLEHRERKDWVAQIAGINRRINENSSGGSSEPWP